MAQPSKKRGVANCKTAKIINVRCCKCVEFSNKKLFVKVFSVSMIGLKSHKKKVLEREILNGG